MLRLMQVLLATMAVTFLAGFFLPSQWGVERSEVIAAEPTAIYQQVASLRGWPEWTAWNKEMDPSGVWSFSGPESGAGAQMHWVGAEERLNTGSLIITEGQPESGIRYQLEIEKGYTTEGSVRFERWSGGTKVSWSTGGKFPGGPMAGWFRLFVGGMWEEQIGVDFQHNLRNLKSVVETGALPSGPATSSTQSGGER